jgi:hypothetical protein
MSKRDQAILTLVGVLAVAAAAWLLVISPKRDEVAQINTQLTAAQATLAQANSDVARYTAARTEIRKSRARLAAAGRALPSQVAMPSLLRELEQTAKNDGVTMTTLNSSGTAGAATDPSATTSTAPSGVTAVSLTLSFDGRFLPLQQFLSDLQKFVKVSHKNFKASGRLLAVNSVNLGAGQGGLPDLTAAVSATVYVLDPLSAQPTTAAPATTGTTTPSTSSTTTTTTTPSTTSTASPTPTATAEVPK